YMLAEDRPGEAADLFAGRLERDGLEDGQRLELLLRLAQARAVAEEADAAVAAIDEAAKLAPANPLVLFQQGLIRGSVGRIDEGIEKLQSFVDRFRGKNPAVAGFVRQARLSLSGLRMEAGDDVGARLVLEELYEEDPEDVSVNNDLGYLYAEAGLQLEKALGMTRKAVAAEPNNAAYLDSLGWVLFKLGRYEEAAVELEKAVAAPDGREPVLLDHLGDAYAAVGRDDDAAEVWREALGLIVGDAETTTISDPELAASLREKLGIADDGPAADDVPGEEPAVAE
ncbi:MAG: tetratricopeptide repeat protein, partial [Planctomycetota bacterium]